MKISMQGILLSFWENIIHQIKIYLIFYLSKRLKQYKVWSCEFKLSH